MNIYFASNLPGSNPLAMHDYIANDYPGTYNLTFKDSNHIDIAITDNGRHLANMKSRIKLNTQHGNLFLGDTSPEPQYNINLTLAASESERNMMIKNGYHPYNVLPTGQPRTDRLFHLKDRKDIKEKYLLSKGLNPLSPTMLYAPTYSRGAFGFGKKLFFASSESLEQDVLMARALMSAARFSHFNIIIRLHKYLKRIYGPSLLPPYLAKEFEHAHVHDNDSEPDSIPVLCATDVLVTDFSSIAADFLALDRPIVFVDPQVDWSYTDKWHATKDDRLAIGKVVKTHMEMMNAVVDFKDWGYSHVTQANRSVMIDKFQPNFDGKCSERVFQTIMRRYGQQLLEK